VLVVDPWLRDRAAALDDRVAVEERRTLGERRQSGHYEGLTEVGAQHMLSAKNGGSGSGRGAWVEERRASGRRKGLADLVV
jgi:hypothetical protein